MDALTQLMGASPAPWYRQAFDDHEMTVARDGGAGLAIWTTGGVRISGYLAKCIEEFLKNKL